MPIRQFEPSRAVEIIPPKNGAGYYGTGYRIGGRLVLTAAHLLKNVGSDCEVRDKPGFGRETAHVVWKAQDLDLALIELPERVAAVEAITLGKLPKATTGEKLAFQMYAYPLWARTQRDQGSAAGGRQIEGTIYLADRSPDGLLVLEAERLPPEATTAQSEWLGASGAAIVCDGLVIAVQSQHQNPSRPASLEGTPLWKIYKDKQWRQLLGKHFVSPKPKVARLSTTETPLEIDWHNISAQLLEERRQLTTNLITRRGDAVYEVDQVFVPLGLVERKKVPRRREDVSPERGSELYQEGMRKGSREPELEQEEITQKFEHQQFLEQVLQQGQSPKSQGKRLAIIGEPGAGKTTFLQQVGRWVSDTFPEAIVIWVSLADLRGDTMESYLEQRWLRSIIRHLGKAEASQADKRNFANQVNQGRVWLLLDGLDEMQVASNPLSDIQRQIQEGGWLQQTRILLTCRVNLWGSSRNALDSFDTYRTLEFVEPGQVELFIEKWFAPRGNYATQQGQALCQALQEPGKERIRDLVKNPLRLTLLCFDWYAKSGRLPETQAELYQRFVERIYDWKAEEFPTTEGQRQQLNQNLAQLSLAAIDDQDERGNARFRLRHQFVREHLSEDSLNLALKLGWLNDIGVDAEDLSETVYAFYHTTFEEYFAALAIEDSDFFLPRNHRNRPVKDKHYRIFEPQWKQVFLLWLGRNGGELAQIRDFKQQKETLIRALTNFKDGCKGFYCDRAFLLATYGIAEFKNCTGSDAVIKRLLQWQSGRSKQWSDPFGSIRSIYRGSWATSALENTDLRRVIQTMVRLLKSTQNEYTRKRVIESLGRIGVGNEMAIRALTQVLQSIHDEYTLRRVIESLNQIDPGNETAIRALTQLLKSTQDKYIRRRAAESLGQIGTGNETAIRALAQLLESTQDKYIRRRTAENLGQIGTDNEMAIQALAKLLQSSQDEDIDIQNRAIKSLGQIGTGNETAIRALVRLLESTQDEDTQRMAVESLGHIGVGNKTAIQTLTKLLESDQDENTWMEIAKSLNQIDPGNETAIRALTQLLKSTNDENIQRWVAKILSQIETGNETAIWTLVQLLESTQVRYNSWRTFIEDVPQRVAENLGQTETGDVAEILREMERLLKSAQDKDIPEMVWAVYTQWKAAQSLGQIGTGNETAIRALVQLLDFSQYPYIHWIVAKNLGQIGTGNETAIQALAQLLQSTQDEETQRMTAESLNQIDPGNETAVRALVKLLESTPDEYTRRDAVESLGHIGMTSNETAIQALAQLLQSTQNEETRRRTIESLGRIGTGSEIAIQALTQLLESTQDEETRSRAIESLGRIGMGSEIAIQALTQLLQFTQNENTLSRAAESLGQIGVGNKMAIQAMMQLLESIQDENTLSRTVESLNRIDSGNESAIRALVRLMDSAQNENIRRRAAESLRQIDPDNEVAIQTVLRAIRPSSSSKESYQLMVRCAEVLPYPKFYQAFHASR